MDGDDKILGFIGALRAAGVHAYSGPVPGISGEVELNFFGRGQAEIPPSDPKEPINLEDPNDVADAVSMIDDRVRAALAEYGFGG